MFGDNAVLQWYCWDTCS